MIINQETIGHKFKRKTEKESLVSSSSLALVMQTGHKLSFNTPISKSCSCFASSECCNSLQQDSCSIPVNLASYVFIQIMLFFFTQYMGSLNTNVQVTAWEMSTVVSLFHKFCKFLLARKSREWELLGTAFLLGFVVGFFSCLSCQGSLFYLSLTLLYKDWHVNTCQTVWGSYVTGKYPRRITTRPSHYFLV